MSLDFYLVGEPKEVDCYCGHCGNEHKTTEQEQYFWKNITHNLVKMAMEAGIYDCLWRPDENGFVFAKDIIQSLSIGIDKLLKDPEHFRTFNPKNNWGSYQGLVTFAVQVKSACEEFPDKLIRVSV